MVAGTERGRLGIHLPGPVVLVNREQVERVVGEGGRAGDRWYLTRQGERLAEPVHRLGMVVAQRPVPARRAAQAYRGGRVAPVDRPAQGGGEVVPLRGDPVQPDQLLVAAQVRLGRLDQLQEVPRVRVARGLRL